MKSTSTYPKFGDLRNDSSPSEIDYAWGLIEAEFGDRRCFDKPTSECWEYMGSELNPGKPWRHGFRHGALNGAEECTWRWHRATVGWKPSKFDESLRGPLYDVCDPCGNEPFGDYSAIKGLQAHHQGPSFPSIRGITLPHLLFCTRYGKPAWLMSVRDDGREHAVLELRQYKKGDWVEVSVGWTHPESFDEMIKTIRDTRATKKVRRSRSPR